MQDFSGMRDNSRAPAALFVEGVVVASGAGVSPIYARVRLPGYHTGVPDAGLPLYRVSHPPSQTGHNVNGRSKQYATLAPGTRVECLLRDPEGYSGSVIAVYPNESSASRPAGLLHGWEDEVGNAVYFYTDGRVTVKDKSGATTHHDGLGNISIVAKNIVFNGKESVTVNTDNWIVNSNTVTMIDSGVVDPTLTPRVLTALPITANLKDW